MLRRCLSSVLAPVLFLAPVLLPALAVPSQALAQQSVVFQKRPAQAGDSAEQSIQCDLQLIMSIRQSGQTVQEQKQALQREQRRHLTILQVEKDKPLQAEVRYEASSVTVHQAEGKPEKISQAVMGKAYRVTRKGKELLVTYPDGKAPAAEEVEIVRSNMEAFGLPNPIAEFFHGKKVRVGESLTLPSDLARELLGFAEAPGTVSSFQLALQEVRAAEAKGESPVAVFTIELRADDAQQNGVQMQLTGQLEMEVATCRSRVVKLAGPVLAEETHGPKNGEFQVRSEGDVEVAVRADYTSRR